MLNNNNNNEDIPLCQWPVIAYRGPRVVIHRRQCGRNGKALLCTRKNVLAPPVNEPLTGRYLSWVYASRGK